MHPEMKLTTNQHMIVGLEQEGGSLIAPNGALHPIDNR